jgi:hypothetical protein
MKVVRPAKNLIAIVALVVGTASVRGAGPAPEEFVGWKWGSSDEVLKKLVPAEKNAKGDGQWIVVPARRNSLCCEACDASG